MMDRINTWLPKEFNLLVLDWIIICILWHLYYTSLDLIHPLDLSCYNQVKTWFPCRITWLVILSTLSCSKITFFFLISQSLEDVDDCEGVLPEGESSKARKTPDPEVDVAPDGDEDEGIEEEEEYFGMVFKKNLSA